MQYLALSLTLSKCFSIYQTSEHTSFIMVVGVRELHENEGTKASLVLKQNTRI